MVYPPEGNGRYTFSRNLNDVNNLPRGGNTVGPKVKLDSVLSEQWIHLKKQELSDYERDRRAILSMAGDYRVSFDFVETINFVDSNKLDRPYQSWATERIYVLKDRSDFISLQHILVMFFVVEGKIEGPNVVKHWRQDWTYEPEYFHEYRGNNSWVKKNLINDEVKGKWLQEVFHVDDSPRYASIGKWEHNKKFSIWEGNKTYRPLPRREFSVRDDYNVLIAENKHIILPHGWIHEQENFKVAMNEDGTENYIAKESGLNSYDRISEFDFSGGDKYWERTKDYWEAVREVWTTIYNQNPNFIFTPKLYEETLINKQFTFAEESENLTYDEKVEHARTLIKQHIEINN